MRVQLYVRGRSEAYNFKTTDFQAIRMELWDHIVTRRGLTDRCFGDFTGRSLSVKLMSDSYTVTSRSSATSLPSRYTVSQKVYGFLVDIRLLHQYLSPSLHCRTQNVSHITTDVNKSKAMATAKAMSRPTPVTTCRHNLVQKLRSNCSKSALTYIH